MDYRLRNSHKRAAFAWAVEKITTPRTQALRGRRTVLERRVAELSASLIQQAVGAHVAQALADEGLDRRTARLRLEEHIIAFRGVWRCAAPWAVIRDGALVDAMTPMARTRSGAMTPATYLDYTIDPSEAETANWLDLPYEVTVYEHPGFTRGVFPKASLDAALRVVPRDAGARGTQAELREHVIEAMPRLRHEALEAIGYRPEIAEIFRAIHQCQTRSDLVGIFPAAAAVVPEGRPLTEAVGEGARLLMTIKA